MNMYLQGDISIIILRIVRNTKFDEHCIDRKTSPKPEQFFSAEKYSYDAKLELQRQNYFKVCSNCRSYCSGIGPGPPKYHTATNPFSFVGADVVRLLFPDGRMPERRK